jgi:hypothetical protein
VPEPPGATDGAPDQRARPLMLPPRPPSNPEPPAPSSPHTDPEPPQPVDGSAAKRNLIGVAVLVVAIVGAVGFAVLRPTPVRLTVDGEPIANAGSLLEETATPFRALVDEDDAELHPEARCYFTHLAEGSNREAPRLACGPVALGISQGDRSWVVGTATYRRNGSGGGVTGQFDRFVSVESIEHRALRRPDGTDPPRDPELVAPTTGVRTAEGRRIADLGEVLTVADADFRGAALDGGAAVHDDSRCYAGATTSATGGHTTDGSLWCGPVALVDSGPDQRWVEAPLRVRDGSSLVVAEASPPSFGTVRAGSTAAVPAGVSLHRPDGATPPERTVVEPPDPDPQVPGHVDVLDRTPAGVELDGGSGRLATPSLVLDIEGSGRTTKVGTGPEALVAADGEVFVVAALVRRGQEGGPPGAGAAAVVVDGERRSVPRWSSLPDRAVLVASVPEGATSVDLEVEFEGRAQTISLLTGELGEGAPAALYRRTTTGVARTVQVTVPLPAGEPVAATGRLTDAHLEAWRRGDGWAPPGQAFLTLAMEDWSVSRPCCDVRDVESEATWQFVLPDGTRLDPHAVAASGAPAPTFLVPEDTTGGVVELVVRSQFNHADQPGEASGAASVPVELPG